MQMKGYTYQQETSRQVGLEAMKHGIAGEGGGAGVLGDVASLGVALGAMGGVIGMTKDALNPLAGEGSMAAAMSGAMAGTAPEAATRPQEGWTCPSCQTTGNMAKFCGECGEKKPEGSPGWTCNCGQTGITSKFCPECGSKRPEGSATWHCPQCGQRDVSAKFCPECGTKRPE